MPHLFINRVRVEMMETIFKRYDLHQMVIEYMGGGSFSLFKDYCEDQYGWILRPLGYKDICLGKNLNEACAKMKAMIDEDK